MKALFALAEARRGTAPIPTRQGRNPKRDPLRPPYRPGFNTEYTEALREPCVESFLEAQGTEPFWRGENLRGRRKSWPLVLTRVRYALILGILLCRAASFPVQTAGTSSVNTVEVHVGRGYEDVQNQRFQEAIGEFQAALALNPGLVRVRYELAVCYFALRQFSQSRNEFKQVLQQEPGNRNAIYYLGRLDLMEEDLDSAVSMLASVAAQPPFPDTPFYLGLAYLKRGELQLADKWLSTAAEIRPHDFRVHEQLARVYQKSGRQEEAEKLYALSAQQWQTLRESRNQAIECDHALDTQALEKAQTVCDKLFDLTDPDKLTILGELYGRQGYYTQALKPLEIVASFSSDSFDLQYNLGLTYFHLKRYAEARAPLERAVRLRPDYFGSSALLGASLYALRDDQQAFDILSRAHQLKPQDKGTSNLLFKESEILGQEKCASREYVSCARYWRKAAELEPTVAEVHRHLAEVYRWLGQTDEAAREGEAAERLRGPDLTKK
jgi:tetratricopeptide (TPR) repeat protein